MCVFFRVINLLDDISLQSVIVRRFVVVAGNLGKSMEISVICRDAEQVVIFLALNFAVRRTNEIMLAGRK